jgi:TolB protein
VASLPAHSSDSRTEHISIQRKLTQRTQETRETEQKGSSLSHETNTTTIADGFGIFEAATDIGEVGVAGSTVFDGESYSVTGSGSNMWLESDAFHFVWTEVSGDQSLSAAISFVGDGAEAHRKACLIVRQSLDPASAYAGIAVHGDGLTSLQYRTARGETTHEIRSHLSAPDRVGLRRHGDYVSATVDGSPGGGSARLTLTDPYYIGFAVCSHTDEVPETAIFTDVVLERPADTGSLVSALETLNVRTGNRSSVRTFEEHIEAPNWTHDGRLVYNSRGRIFSIPASGGEIASIDTGFADRCNNDHGLSPDGRWIAISHQAHEDDRSAVYTVPASGGTPTRITEGSPSYWHGWSPDGSTISFCGQRDGSFGIFTIPAGGGEETRLTTAAGLDDGPEYSPDGEWIYFNSDRSGLMQIYRMRTDGSELTRMTDDGFGNWFPHLSPDGTSMLFLAYGPEVVGHPADKDVALRLMDLSDRSVRTLVSLFGGQGTANVHSWSPDGTKVAFVSYDYV